MKDLPSLIIFMEGLVDTHRSRPRDTLVDQASLRFLEDILEHLRAEAEGASPGLDTRDTIG